MSLFLISYYIHNSIEYLMIITISGLHGVGKSVYAKKLAKIYSLKYISSGSIFRRIAKNKNMKLEELSKLAEKDRSIDYLIDSTIMKEALSNKNAVVDGLLTGWLLKDKADLKIWIKAKDEIRFIRIAKRDKIPLKEAKLQTIIREKSEIKRFKQYYNIDISDLSIYDFVIDTSYLDVRTTLEIICKIVDKYKSKI